MDGHLKIAICQVSHMAVYHARYLISEYTFIFFPLSLFLRAIIMLLNVPKTKLEKLLTFFLFFSLNHRFNGGKFYTYIGEVCVSVNPYRTLNIYGPDHVSQYKGDLREAVG